MTTTILVVVVIGMLVLSVISGMLGLGVAFAAVPFLSFFLSDLVNEVQPLSLLLNGVTALVAAVGFAISGFIDWRKAMSLAFVTTIFAPLGAVMAHVIPASSIWVISWARLSPLHTTSTGTPAPCASLIAVLPSRAWLAP